jgi:hypothetical protein
MHADDYHKDADARARCWSCSHPEKLEPTEADRALAAELVAAGWRSTSNKYYSIKLVKVPAIDEVLVFTDAAPDWLRKELREEYARWSERFWHRTGGGAERTLTSTQFRAFKQAGGRVA